RSIACARRSPRQSKIESPKLPARPEAERGSALPLVARAADSGSEVIPLLVSNFEQTSRRPGCFHFCVRFEYEHPGSSDSLSGVKKEIEDLAAGHALAF